MKRLLLPFGSETADKAPVNAAKAVAERFDGHVTAMFYPRLPDPVIVDPMSGGVVSYEGIDDEVEQQRRHARGQLDARLSSAGFGGDRLTVTMNALTNWRQVGEESRVHDLTVLARTTASPHWQTLFEMALFEGGRPVMLSPEDWSGNCGDTIAIAWNRSTETARLIGQTLPLLRAAKKVYVLELEGWHIAGPDGAALVRYLVGHGVQAERNVGPTPASGNGAQVLADCKERGVDLLLKGAYTQSRLTQMIFGGATRQILEQTTVPVIFAH